MASSTVISSMLSLNAGCAKSMVVLLDAQDEPLPVQMDIYKRPVKMAVAHVSSFFQF